MVVLWPHNYSATIPGAGVFMHQQAQSLREEGLKVDLHYMGNLRNPANLIFGKERLKNKFQKYDLVHAQFGSACGYTVSRLSCVKIISLRGSDWYGNRSGSFFSRMHGLLQKKLTERSLESFDGLIVMSHRMRRAIEKFKPNKKIWVIPAGINLKMFNPIDRMKARELLGQANDNTPWVFFPSIIESNSVKRPNLAKESVREAQKKIPEIKLKIGFGIPHDMMPLYYNASDIVLLTSTHEGWPNSIKEALACNIPFVSTDVSDLKIISKQESNCKVVSATAKDIGEAIVSVLRMERNENLRRYVRDMALKEVTRKIIDVYEELL